MRANQGSQDVSATRLATPARPGTWRLLPTLLRKPAVVGRWLATAHAAQAAAALLGLAMTFAAPAAIDATLDLLHPPEQRHVKVLGFIKVPRVGVREQIETSRILATRACWAGAAGVVLWLLCAHLPRATTEAAALARRREREGDGLDPGDRRRLSCYRASLRLALDRHQEEALLSKIEQEAEHAPGSPTPRGAALVGRYLIHEQIGRGGMGVVYRATDMRLDREIALKQVPPDLASDPEFAGHLRREARALARLSHPSIVQVFDLIEEADGLWVALELVDGVDLGAHLRGGGPFPAERVAAMGASLADALGYAHGRGVLHRDVKPANVLLTSTCVPKLTDFGIAKLRSSTLRTHTGAIVGSPHYMSPEQVRGEVLDARSDVYSLGVTLYELLAGRVPFEGEPLAVLALHTGAEPPPLADVADLPGGLEELVMQMLAKSREDRPADMTEVSGRLASFAKAS